MAETVNVVSLQSPTGICFNLVFLIATWSRCTVKGEGHRAVGPPQDIVWAVEGGDAILPCIIEPPYDMERGTVQWTRPDRPDPDPLDPQYVYLRQGGRYIEGVIPEYIRRVSLLAETLPHGDISLRLSGVDLSDQGTYRCSVPPLDISTEIKLLVGSVSQPVISSNGSLLTCDSGCWFPTPEMFWLDSNGTIIDPAGRSVTNRTNNSQQCYEVQSTVTVTRTGQVTCRVQLPLFNHAVDVSFHIVHLIVISERDVRTEGASTGSAEIAVIAILVFISAVLAGVVLYYRRSKHAERERRLTERRLTESRKSSGFVSLSGSVEEIKLSRKGSRETGIGDSSESLSAPGGEPESSSLVGT